MAFTSGQCIQDQYGNRYTLNIDQARQYITGTVISGPFGGGPWILTGSYVQGGPTDSWIYELTVTNVNGTSQPNYVQCSKLGEWTPAVPGTTTEAFFHRRRALTHSRSCPVRPSP
jgi:hypothetical protein